MTLTAFVREVQSEPRRLVLSVAVTLLLVAVVAPFVVYAVPQVVGADQSYVVLSGSMEPSISPGDVVVVASVDPGTLAAGDVITFTRGTQEIPTTHRIVEVVDEDGTIALRTMGDANEDPDAGTVPATAVIGRVAFVLPFIGHVVTAVNTQLGFVALVIAPFAILVITEAYDRFVKPRREEDGLGEGTSESGLNADAVADGTADGSADGSGMGSTAESATEPAATSPEPPATDAAGDGFAVTSTDLTLVLVVLGVLAVYSAVVAYTTSAEGSVLTLASVMVTVAAVGCLAFGLYVRHEAPSAAMVGATVGATADGGRHERIVTGIPADTRWSPRVTVASVDTLVRMADASNRWVVANPESQEHVLYADGVAYVARPGAVTTSETDPTPETGLDQEER